MGHLTLRDGAIAVGGRTILRGVDLDVRTGAMLAIVGPNGSGKTSLLQTLAGERALAAGSLELDGTPLAARGASERARAIAHVPADLGIPTGMTLLELALTARFAHRTWWDWRRDANDADRARAAIERVGLEAFADRGFDTLSSGERRRGWIAFALAQEAPVLLLDEPTSNLDIRYAYEVLALLADLARDGHAVAIVVHDLDQALAFATDAAVLAGGRVESGPAAHVLDAPHLERAFGIAFDVIETADGRRITARPPAGNARGRPIVKTP